MKPSRALPVITLLLLTLTACSDAPSPEEQIRVVMQRAERAVEDGDLNALMKLVSDDYEDAAGRDKKTLRGIVAFYMRQNDKLHVFYQEKKLVLADPDRGDVTAVVALAGQPLGRGLDLSTISADLLRVYVTFERQSGDFKVVHAEWDGARLTDFVID